MDVNMIGGVSRVQTGDFEVGNLAAALRRPSRR